MGNVPILHRHGSYHMFVEFSTQMWLFQRTLGCPNQNTMLHFELFKKMNFHLYHIVNTHMPYHLKSRKISY